MTKRTSYITIRVTQEEKQVIEYEALRLGVGNTDVVRAALDSHIDFDARSEDAKNFFARRDELLQQSV